MLIISIKCFPLTFEAIYDWIWIHFLFCSSEMLTCASPQEMPSSRFSHESKYVQRWPKKKKKDSAFLFPLSALEGLGSTLSDKQVSILLG